MRRKRAFLLLILILIPSYILFFTGTFVSFALNDSVQGNTIGVEVYVIALEHVAGHGVDNVSRVVDGVLSACQVDTLYYWTGGWASFYSPASSEIKINVNVTVVDGWDVYKAVVETSSRAIIVNAHGETVLVPSGYAKEDWADKIAEAMAYRNVTWVHTAGYPFYHYHQEESGEGEWGEEGFQRLMSHIGKNNVTCRPPDSEKIWLSGDAKYTVMHGWYGIYDAYWVDRGKPLKASDFRDCLVATIWGAKEGYPPGAIIKFAKPDATPSFGFYVHVGAGQTYEYNGEMKTDRDFHGGYAGTAQAIYTFSFRLASEGAISDAEIAIAKAEAEGRTERLDKAIALLQEAKYWHGSCDAQGYKEALIKANKAEEAADRAIKPSFLETYGSYLITSGVAGLTIASALLMRWRRNSRKRNEER